MIVLSHRYWRCVYSIVCFTLALCLANSAHAQTASLMDWNHWRGPTENGGAIEADPPTKWSATENVKWKMPIPGRGSGSPIVTGNRVFVVTAVPTGKGPVVIPQNRGRGGRGGNPIPLQELDFNVLCFDRESGKELWTRTAITATPHQGTHSTNGYASASPMSDGEHVYAFFGSRGLYCYTLDGELVWKRDDFGQMQTRNDFGEGNSCTISGDKIIVPWDHEGPSSVYALDKLTGKTIWKTERDEPTNWATPLVVDAASGKQVIMSGQNKVRAYDLETGKELWYCGGQTQRPCATPVAMDGLVIVGSGHRGSYMGAFRLDGSGNIEGTDKVVWSINRDTPDIASPVLSENRLFFYKAKQGILSCHDPLTGKPYYTATRIPGIDTIYASPVAAGGYVFLTGRNGTTVVIRDTENLEIVSTNSVGEGVDATPAVSGDRLFIRGENHLFCIGS